MDENLPQPEMVSQLPTTQPAVPAAQTPQPTQTAPSGDIVSQLQDAIGQYESGGDYTAVGKKTASGDQAYGKYQIMGSNIPAWTQQALGLPNNSLPIRRHRIKPPIITCRRITRSTAIRKTWLRRGFQGNLWRMPATHRT